MKRASLTVFLIIIVYLIFAPTLPEKFFSGNIISASIKDINFSYQYFLIDTLGGPTAIGDIDGDGFNDVVLMKWGNQRGQVYDGLLAWYQYPEWSRYVIGDSTNFFGDAVETCDWDCDGDQDIITSRGNDNLSQIWWYENRGIDKTDLWQAHYLDTVETGSEVKNLEIADIDGDNRPDIIIRTINILALFYQITTDSVFIQKMKIHNREGLELGDLNGDGNLDIILNGFFLMHPKDPLNDEWFEFTIDEQWFSAETKNWQDNSAMIATGDMNNDGNLDVVYSNSENEGFYLTWYENKGKEAQKLNWIKHEIAVIDYCHSLEVADIDRDGDTDIVVGRSIRDKNPILMAYLNEGDGESWQNFVIDDKGVYKSRLGDIDNDGDLDILSARSWEDPPLQLWCSNQNPPILSLDRWQRYLIEPALPERGVFLEKGDLDGDSLVDLAAGSWWWKNPGTFSEKWDRNEIGTPLHNISLLHDFDQDGDLDVFGTRGVGSESNNGFAWAQNDGNGKFSLFTNIISGGTGDFLQGCKFLDSGRGPGIALSWHNGGGGLHELVLPDNLSEKIWDFVILSDFTLKEDLSIGDIDRDGDLDLLLGTVWLRNNEDYWSEHVIDFIQDLDDNAEPDRNELVDINNDNRLDAVIGLENGEYIIWYEAPAEPENLWKRHIIGEVEGEGFSLDAADLDNDLDIDVVVGEHRGINRNRVIIFENKKNGLNWVPHVIDSDSPTIIDHHNGTQLVDIDNDGDLDIASIGWDNKKIWIYENGAKQVSDLIQKQIYPFQDYLLYQNYPNPFNPSTTVEFFMPKKAKVQLVVFNLTGQIISTIYNGYKAAGQHFVTFNASNLASGIYLYQLKIGDWSFTRKMIYIH
jgi:hypothetical protein